MSSEWQELSIDELKADTANSIAIGPFGSRMKSDCYVQSGVSVIRGTNLTSGREFSGDFVFITPEKAQELGGANLQPDDLVFPHRGSIGEVGIVPNDGKQYVLSSSLMKLKCDWAKANPLFIYYFFKSSKGRAELLKNTSQVGTPGIGQPLTSLKSIRLRLPDVTEQERIANFLCVLDDRIALLRETNATLEAIAQALFKSWFVDFDPVHAKQQGRAPEGMDEFTAALFPESFEESELGLVPKGWRGSPLNKLCNISSGKRPNERNDNETPRTNIPLFGGAGIMGFTNESLFDSAKIVTGRVGTLGKVHIAYPPFWASDNVLVLSPFNSRSFYFCFHWLLSINVHSLNRGSTQPLLTQRDLGNQIHVVPTDDIFEIFENIVKSIYRKVRDNTERAQTLTTLRDTLLPRLICDQLRLPKVESMIEDTGT